MSDVTILLRDVAGDAATKAAGKVNPSDDQLAQIDRPAEDNQWHEAPNFGEMKTNLQDKYNVGKKEAKDIGGEAAGDASQAGAGTRDPASAAEQAQADREQGTSTTDPKTGANQGIATAKNRLGERFNEDQKEQMRKYRERTNNYFKEKVPKDRRDQTIFRLKKMIVEIQTHQDCRFCCILC